MEFISEIGVFVVKALVIVIGFALIVGIASTSGERRKGRIKISSLSNEFHNLRHILLPSKLQKKFAIKEKKYEKRTFVLDFKGSLTAPEVERLRHEVNAILESGNPNKDTIVIRIESPGGAVTGYGLGASQIQRLRDAGFYVVATVDQVAASGGYLMASVANKIVAAPFSIIGSIGVVAQMPNFYKLLDKLGINYEVITAGEYKRTLTMFTENDDKGREKFKEDLVQIHNVFKEHVSKFRPDIDIEDVAKGDHWMGQDALGLKLVDALSTSDDVIRSLVKERNNEVLHLQYVKPQPISKRLKEASSDVLGGAFERVLTRLSDTSKHLQ